ncbi:MAG: hypothetical protein ACPGLY_26240 [Rubripirellula sp.]
MAKQLRAPETETAWAKKMGAEQALDMEILKEAAEANWQALNVLAQKVNREKVLIREIGYESVYHQTPYCIPAIYSPS